jgi:hypothetical protein
MSETVVFVSLRARQHDPGGLCPQPAATQPPAATEHRLLPNPSRNRTLLPTPY